MNAAAESARVRAELLATRGAHLCGTQGCQVITQNGLEGLRQHARVVHGSARSGQVRSNKDAGRPRR